MKIKFGHHGLKEGKIELPHGVTLALSVTGDVVAIDATGKRRTLDNHDDVRWFYHAVTDSFPPSPRIPYDPALAQQVQDAKDRIEANKQHNLIATKDADGNIVLKLDDGTVATIPAA